MRLFPVFISPIVWNMCEHLHYESVINNCLLLVQSFFLLQIQRINTTNIVNISTEFVNSDDKIKNKDVLLEMMNDLFSSVRRVISPITRRNSVKVLQLGEVRSKRKL